jgi:hypothetical protein
MCQASRAPQTTVSAVISQRRQASPAPAERISVVIATIANPPPHTASMPSWRLRRTATPSAPSITTRMTTALTQRLVRNAPQG